MSHVSRVNTTVLDHFQMLHVIVADCDPYSADLLSCDADLVECDKVLLHLKG